MADALRRARCREVWIGAESGSQKILDAMNKGIRVPEIVAARRLLGAEGIRVGFFLQLGYLGEELEDILATRDLVDHARPDDIGVSVSYPLPGTKFHELVKEQLGSKRNWQESNDLEMMFSGTYRTEFYRSVRDLLHDHVTQRASPCLAAAVGRAGAAGRAVSLAATARRDRRSPSGRPVPEGRLMADVLLTHGYFLAEDEKERQIMKPYPPLGLLYLSAFLKTRGYSVDVFDSTFEERDRLTQRFAREPRGTVGIYTNLMTRRAVLEIIRSAKQHQWTVILGGPESANYIAEYLECGADVVVIGEGELTIAELLAELARVGPQKLQRVHGIAFRDEDGAIVRNRGARAR